MRVILFLLKCIVGILATVGFLIVGGIALLVLYASDADQVRKLALQEEESAGPRLITLDIADGLVERDDGQRILRALQLDGRAITLSDAVEALERASADPEVEGLVAHLGRGGMGLAQVQDLRKAITSFRSSGKPAFAFAESFGEAGDGMLHYYLASAFEEVWMQPSASFDVTGFHLASPYLRDFFDEFGIQPRFDQRKEYKGLASTFIESEQPEPVRRNLQQLVDSMLEGAVEDIAAARSLPPAEVRAAIDRGPLSAEETRQARLVDGLTYWDVFIDAVEARISADYQSIPLQRYAEDTKPEVSESAQKIAYITAIGGIVLGPGSDSPLGGTGGQISSDQLSDAISSAIEEPSIRAIVLRIDSPGGSYVASDTIWRQVKRAGEQGKPLIVSMGNVAASGGYFIAAPAMRIVAQPGTITGSIGVAGGKFVIDELLGDLGVSIGDVSAGRNADFYAATSDFTPEQLENLSATLDRIYEDFTAKVAEGRGLTAEQVEAAAGGRVWTGADALRQGLVDTLGGLDTAIDIARSESDIPPGADFAVVPWPEEKDPWAQLFEDFSGAPFASLARIEAALGVWLLLAEDLQRDPRSTLLLDRRFEERGQP
jgi:protease-4